MNNFQKTEQIGREKFSSGLEAIKATDIEFTEDEYCALDCTFKDKGFHYGVEIKVRDEKYKDYDTHFLEQVKLEGMLKFQEDNELDVLIYANFFGDGLFLYKLRRQYESVTRNLARTTAANNGWKRKEIILLEADNAVKFYNNEGKGEKK